MPLLNYQIAINQNKPELYALKRILLLMLALSSIVFSSSVISKAIDELSPQELVAIAVTFNIQTRYQEAADLLERALLLSPEIRGGLDEYQKAITGIQRKSKNKGLNNNIAPLMERRWAVNKEAYAKVGVSDNLNRAPTNSVIPLTISGQSLNVMLADDERPKPGQTIELGVSLEASSRLNSKTELMVSADILQRQSTQTGFTNYQWGTFAATWVETLAKGRRVIWGVTADLLKYDEQRPFYVLQGMVRYGLPLWQDCAQYMGVDVQHQGQQKNKALDGQYLGGVLAFNCHKNNKVYAVQLSLGRDWASNQRLGGDQTKARLQMNHTWNVEEFFQGGELSTTLNYYRQQDKKGYTTVLHNGRKREVKRIDVSIEYAWPLQIVGESWQGFVNTQWIRQRSNLLLFETTAQEAWVGIKKSW